MPSVTQSVRLSSTWVFARQGPISRSFGNVARGPEMETVCSAAKSLGWRTFRYTVMASSPNSVARSALLRWA